MTAANPLTTSTPLLLPQSVKLAPSGRSKSSGPPPNLSPAHSDFTEPPILNNASETQESLVSEPLSFGGQTEHLNSRRSLSEGAPSPTSSLDSPSPTIWYAEASSTLQTFSTPFLDMKHTQFLSSGALGLTNDSHTDSSHSHLQSTPRVAFNTEASIYSSLFPQYHQLNTNFVQTYQLEDELGSGGYGFVMTALDRAKGHEVAVKFIIKDKVPEHAWMEDESFGKLPTEVVLLGFINHENIVRCIDLFEDHLYYYLVQELHGCPWKKDHKLEAQTHCKLSSSSLSTPALSPSTSVASLPASEPATPPTYYASLREDTVPTGDHEDIPKLLQTHLSISQSGTRPDITRRPSHDLFECIEQSEHKRLTEAQARFVFAQVVDAVDYLDHHGIAHRDIKDENLVIDKHLNVKLIDFGSAIAVDPNELRPFYKLFYGTAAYASSEILRKVDYQAAPAEVWTLGVLLSYLLAGISPFPNVRDAVDGRIFLSQKIVGKISTHAMDLMRQCLDPNPQTRITLSQIKFHPWLSSQD